MPPLLDALSSLSAQCELIASLSAANKAPTGPYTSAQLSERQNIINIIRDAEEHEKRLFSFIGDAPVGSGKKIDRRDNVMVTPLRNGLGGHLKGGAGPGPSRARGKGRAEDNEDSAGWNDPGVLLKTALKLVDEYRPMPRAREHIVALLQQYADTQSSIAVLEDNIAESNLPSKSGASFSDSLFDEPMPELHDDEEDDLPAAGPSLTPEEWLKREEDALKAMEAEVAELRKQRAAQAGSSPRAAIPVSPRVDKSASSPRSAIPPPSNGSRLATSPASPKFSLRPAPANSGKQPSPSPSPLAATFGRGAGLARSPGGKSPAPGDIGAFAKRGLARSVGPQAARQASASPIAKQAVSSPAVASPGKLAVPRTPATPSSPIVPSPRRAASTTPSASTPAGSPRAVSASVGRANGKSPARSPLASVPKTPQTPSQDSAAGEGEATPTPKAKATLSAPPSAHKRKVVEGIEIRSDVRSAVTKIWSTLGEILRQGEGSPLPEHTLGTAETIKHIAHLAESPLPPPLSPSTTSTISSLPVPGAPPAAYRAAPLTSTSILTCALLLALLRAPGLVAPMSELKEHVGAVAKQRGWDDGMVTKVIYGAAAKRVVKIDRRGGAGGKLLFDI